MEIVRDFAPGSGVAVKRREGIEGSWQRRNAQQHHHSAIEFCLVVHGTARVLMESELHTLRPGSIVWLPAGQTHAVINLSTDHVMVIVSFKEDFVESFCADASVVGFPLVRHLDESKAAFLASLIAQLQTFDWAEARGGFEFAFRYAWKATIEADDVHPGEGAHPGVERVLDLMLGGNGDVPLEALAEAAGLSPSALCRLFKAQTGFTIVQYRNKLKVEEFVAIYADGRRYNVTEAAFRAGFGSYAQFYRVFVGVTGLTPRQYQKRLAL